MYVCPECHKQLKNKHSLDEHMKRVHGSKPGEPTPLGKGFGIGAVKAKAIAKSKEFNLQIDPDEKVTYKCGACDHSLDGEVSLCPHCGTELNWS